MVLPSFPILGPCRKVSGSFQAPADNAESPGKGIVFVHDGCFFTVVFAGFNDAELTFHFEEDNANHQGLGQVPGSFAGKIDIV